MTISSDYQAEQRRLHDGPYGSSGHYWLGHILEIAEIFQCKSVLDYGCGKATLAPYITRYGLSYTGYDPATRPKKPKGYHDLTVCLDVLEHIEPEHIGAVFQELHAHTAKVLFAVVSTRASSKTLEDGRNAHLIVEPYEWWRPYFTRGWKGARTRQRDDEFEIVVVRNPSPNGVRVPRSMIQEIRGQT